MQASSFIFLYFSIHNHINSGEHAMNAIKVFSSAENSLDFRIPMLYSKLMSFCFTYLTYRKKSNERGL